VPAAAAAVAAGAAEEEVRVAAPAVGDEVSLVDDLRAGLHGREGASGGLGVVTIYLHDGGVPSAEQLEVAFLVLVALPLGEGGFLVAFIRRGPIQRVGSGATGALPLGEHALTPGGEVALEVGDEVARRVP
jgi:hypothetical protein